MSTDTKSLSEGEKQTGQTRFARASMLHICARITVCAWRVKRRGAAAVHIVGRQRGASATAPKVVSGATTRWAIESTSMESTIKQRVYLLHYISYLNGELSAIFRRLQRVPPSHNWLLTRAHLARVVHLRYYLISNRRAASLQRSIDSQTTIPAPVVRDISALHAAYKPPTCPTRAAYRASKRAPKSARRLARFAHTSSTGQDHQCAAKYPILAAPPRVQFQPQPAPGRRTPSKHPRIHPAPRAPPRPRRTPPRAHVTHVRPSSR